MMRALLLVAVTATLAHAQPAPQDPNAPEQPRYAPPSDEEPPVLPEQEPPADVPPPEFDYMPPSDDGPPPLDVIKQVFLRSFAARPVLTPARLLEGGAALRIDFPQSPSGGPRVKQRGTLEVAARYGLRPGDVELGALIHAFANISRSDEQASPQFERLQGAYAIGRVRLRGETTLLGQMYVQTSEDDQTTYRPGLFVQHKKHIAEMSAVELTGGATYSHTSYDTGFDPYRSIELLARLRLQIQIVRLFALEPRAEYRHYELLDSSQADSLRSTSYGLYGLFSPAPELDVIGGVDILENGNKTAWALTLGLVARIAP